MAGYPDHAMSVKTMQVSIRSNKPVLPYNISVLFDKDLFGMTDHVVGWRDPGSCFHIKVLLLISLRLCAEEGASLIVVVSVQANRVLLPGLSASSRAAAQAKMSPVLDAALLQQLESTARRGRELYQRMGDKMAA